MTFRRSLLALAVGLVFVGPAAAQTPSAASAAHVASAGPNGEIATIEEANEIRVVFSEPMVPIARVQADLRPAYFHITPNVNGSFRWSWTTILIFTPTRRLPFATK